MTPDERVSERVKARRVVVTGGRDYANEAAVDAVLSLEPIAELAAGDATGADALALAWARKHGIRAFTYVADWKKHGRRAGPIRNREMLDDFKPDCVIAFEGGRGTADCIRAAKERGITVYDFTLRFPVPEEGGR